MKNKNIGDMLTTIIESILSTNKIYELNMGENEEEYCIRFIKGKPKK